MNPLFLMGLDLVVVLVLLYAVYYLRIVATSITVIRQGKSEMQQVLKEMTLTINKAEDTIRGMKNLADDKGKFLQKQMDGAAVLAEELKFINQAADQVAQRLEKNTATGQGDKTAVKAMAKPPLTATVPASNVTSAPAAPLAKAGASKAEKDLIAAMAKRRAEGN